MGKLSKYAIAENHTFVLPNGVRHESHQLNSMTFEITTPFQKLHSKESKHMRKHEKNWSALPTPVPKVAIFFNVNANNFLKVSDFWFCDAARHNNDDNINIHNALI